MIWYKFFLGDYIRDTHHLADAEDLAYRRLIDMYYMQEGPIQLDTKLVSRKIRLDLDIVEAVLNEFFEKCEDGYRNSRCDKEIAKYQHQVSMNRRSAHLGGRPKKTELEPNRIPNQISDIREKNKTSMSAEPTWFDEFWNVWPASKRKVGKAACKKKWVSRKLDEIGLDIIGHIKVMKETEPWTTGFEPSPLTYLNQSRWEDETPQTVVRRVK
jgi:uncharacterized protein YdaU (DUF1376 family)